jgi:hypothetical protein
LEPLPNEHRIGSGIFENIFSIRGLFVWANYSTTPGGFHASDGCFGRWWRRGPDSAFAAGYGCVVAAVLLFVPARYTPFIYFQF